jgi:hypothetical protein
MSSLSIHVDGLEYGRRARPLTFGIPFPAGELFEPETVRLATGRSTSGVPVQARPLAHWRDGSVRWLLVDTILPGHLEPRASLNLEWRGHGATPPSPAIALAAAEGCLRIDTGAARFSILRSDGTSDGDIRVEAPRAATLAIELRDEKDRTHRPRVEECEIEERGPVRVSVRLRGTLGDGGLRFTARCCFFAATAWMRVLLTIENPRRARHRRGTWDLGDRGSLRFRELCASLRCEEHAASIVWSTARNDSPRRCGARWELYQDSSGGENWRSPVHRNASGHVPTSFRGFRARAGGATIEGLRAEPIAGIEFSDGAIAAAITDFWQSFPTAMSAGPTALQLHLMPRQFADTFELQGGEHRTRELWFDFAADWRAEAGPPLAWTRVPSTARAAPRWYADAGVEAALAAERLHPVAAEILEGAARGPRSLAARREIVDEYGWRNFGDLYADHEERYYDGRPPLVSHYNNQYDVLRGCLLHYLWSGDPAWRDVAAPLFRHVVDIDLYNTADDRPAYNGGLFWHTDHYLDAGTATHRSYSASNRTSPLARYGGGPSCENNYTSGLLLFHYLTGDQRAREAVLQLGDWVVHMDDGRRNVLGLIDEGPTGWATRTCDNWYHGPGRGAGNSLNAVLDAWLLSGERRYLVKAEEIVRRVVHPGDDPDDCDLRDIERRWSYLVFIQSLARYLDEKHRHGELDPTYDYARQSLLTYGRWMLRHETPYFERREQLRYPTEAWPVLDLLKANVLRAVAGHAAADEARRLAARSDELAEHTWRQLESHEHRDSVRALSHLLLQALRDAHWRQSGIVPRPPAAAAATIAPKVAFDPQRARVRRQLAVPAAWPRLLRRLLSPAVWRRVDLRHP